jgi:hypothetical protein
MRHRITLLEWAGMGGAALALVSSFLPWYVLTGTFADQQRVMGFPTWTTVWRTNFLGWFPIVLLVAVGVFILGQRFGKQVPILASLWLTLAVLSVVMILLRWITVPDATERSGQGPEYARLSAGFGLYIGLLAALITGATGFLAFRAEQKKEGPAA